MYKFISTGVFLAAFLFLISIPATAQEKLQKSSVKDISKTPNMAFGAQDERAIKGGIKMYEQLIDSGAEIEHFEIVIWGKIVKDMTENEELRTFIKEHKHDKLKLSVCEVAMSKLGVSEEDLPDGVTPVPNAWIRLYQLQANGYNTLVP